MHEITGITISDTTPKIFRTSKYLQDKKDTTIIEIPNHGPALIEDVSIDCRNMKWRSKFFLQKKINGKDYATIQVLKPKNGIVVFNKFCTDDSFRVVYKKSIFEKLPKSLFIQYSVRGR